MNTPKRVWIYTSIDAPEDLHGALKGQEKELLDYAERLSFSVAGGSSDLGGTIASRPGLAAVIAAAGRSEFDILLVRNLPRLGRKPSEAIAIAKELVRLGVEIYSPLEGKISAALQHCESREIGGCRHA